MAGADEPGQDRGSQVRDRLTPEDEQAAPNPAGLDSPPFRKYHTSLSVLDHSRRPPRIANRGSTVYSKAMYEQRTWPVRGIAGPGRNRPNGLMWSAADVLVIRYQRMVRVSEEVVMSFFGRPSFVEGSGCEKLAPDLDVDTIQ